MDKICNNCGSENENSSKYCHNCGEELKSDEKENKTKPQKNDNITCKNCENENDNNSKFCEECGNDLLQNQSKIVQNKTVQDNKTRNIILILVAAVAVLAVGIMVITMGGITTPTVTNDFGGITMLVPKGSNFVQTDSLPNYGITGGFVIFTNGGEHKDKVNGVMFTTIQGGSHPKQVVLDRVEGDVKIFKDKSGENAYYIEKNVGNYEISIFGRDLQLMLEMINSVQINNPTLNI